MTRFDVMMGKNTEVEKKNKLRLILEEDDPVLKSIEQGMKDNNLKEGVVIDATGFIKDAIISENGEKLSFDEVEILKAKGKFKFGGDDLWGNLEVFTGGKKPTKGQLLRANAKEDFEIVIEY